MFDVGFLRLRKSRWPLYLRKQAEQFEMAAIPARSGIPKSTEPVLFELPVFNAGGDTVAVRLAAWREGDGAWRGRLLFGPLGAEGAATADIFCAPTESDLREAVRNLGDHHIRALYRSVIP